MLTEGCLCELGIVLNLEESNHYNAIWDDSTTKVRGLASFDLYLI